MKICYVEPFLCKYKLQADWSSQGLRAHQKMDVPPTISWQFLASKVLKSTPKTVKQNPKRNAVPSLPKQGSEHATNSKTHSSSRHQHKLQYSSNLPHKLRKSDGWLKNPSTIHDFTPLPICVAWRGDFSPMSPTGVEIWSKVTSLYLT